MNTLAFFWLLLAIPIVLSHMLKRPTDKIWVSSLQFWEDASSQKGKAQSKDLLRLHDGKLLLVRLLILITLVLALLNYSFTWPLSSSQSSLERAVVIIDRTASMNAVDIKPNRFHYVKSQAKNYISQLPKDCEVVLLSFTTNVEVNCRLSDDHDIILQTLDQMKPTHSSGQPDDAMEVAQRITKEISNSEIRLFSDKQVSQTVSEHANNIGITRFHAERNWNTPSSCNLFVEVFSTQKQKSETEIEVTFDSQVIDRFPIEFDEKGKWKKTLTYTLKASGVLHARVDYQDVLEIDNNAYCILPKPERTEVTLISTGNERLESALKAIPNVKFDIQSRVDQISQSADVVVFDEIVPEKIPEWLTQNLFFINPQNSCKFFTLEREDQKRSWTSNSNDTLAEDIPWESIDSHSPHVFKVEPFQEQLAETQNGKPKFIKISQDNYKVLALAGDIQKSNLALRPGFPIMMTKAIQWLSGKSNEVAHSLTTADSSQKAFEKLDSKITHIRSPSGHLFSKSDSLPLNEVGLWTAVSSKEDSSIFAVSLLDVYETRLTNFSKERPTALQPKRYQSRTFFVITAVILVLVECLIQHRLQTGNQQSINEFRTIPLDRLTFQILILACLAASFFMFRFEYPITKTVTKHLISPDTNEQDIPSDLENLVRIDNDQIALELISALATTPDEKIPEINLWSTGGLDSNKVEDRLSGVEIPLTTHFVKPRIAEISKIECYILPDEIRSGNPFELRVVVWNDKPRTIKARLFANGLKRNEKTVDLGTGRNEITFQTQIDDSAHYEILCELRSNENDGSLIDTAKISGSLLSPTQVLIVEQTPGSFHPFKEALETQGINGNIWNVENLESPTSEFSRFSCIILNDLDLSNLHRTTQKKIAQFVEESGGGLLVFGGQNFSVLENDKNLEIQRVLPIRPAKQNEKQKHSLIFALDHSGSMRGEKLLQAKNAIVESIRSLSRETSVGIISFNDRAEWIRLPTTLQRDAFEQSSLSDISATGGTQMSSAMRLLRDRQKSGTENTHIIFLTDGQTAQADLSKEAEQLHATGFTISVLAIGNDIDEKLLQSISQSGSGKYYHSKSIRDIPKILLKETNRSRNENIIEEPFFVEKSKLSMLLTNIDFESIPLLLKANRVEAKSLSEILIRSENGEPILTKMQAGLGQSVFFASSFSSNWGNEWLEWRQFPIFLSQLVRRIAKESSEEFEVIDQWDYRSQQFEVDVSSKFGEPVGNLNLSVQLTQSGKKIDSSKLGQIGVGKYQMQWKSEKLKPGQYEIQVLRDNRDILHSQTVSIPFPPSQLPGFGSKERLDSLEAALRTNKKATWEKSKPLWPYFIALSMIALVTGIGYERNGFYSS